MKIRTTIGAVLLFAQTLTLALCPGGSVLCDEGRGAATFKPFHGPNIFSCCANEDEALVPAFVNADHEHRGCTDTEASGPYAPTGPYKMRFEAAVSNAAALSSEDVASAARPTARLFALSPPLSRHISTTVIRS